MLSSPPVTTSDVDTTVFLVVFGGLACATFVAAIVHGRRTRDVVPVAACLGALVCALNEPIFDELGKIVYAENAVTAYTAFGRDIPLFLVVGYVPWVAGLSVVIATLIARGATARRLQAIAFGSFVSVTCVELVGTSLGSWSYYGEPPLKYLGVSPMMAPVPIVCGALIFMLGTRLKGPSRWLIGLVPVFSLPAVYAAAGMPMYVALHADVGRPVQYAAGVATLALCFLVVLAATTIVDRWRAGDVALRAAAPAG